MAIAADYGRHVLDLRLEDVMPTGPGDSRRTGSRRRALIDQPGVRADDEYHVKRKKVASRADLLDVLKVMIDAALARAGALNSDEDEPDLVALCDKAGLTLSEYEAVVMRGNGLRWTEIGKAQHVSPGAARHSADRGFRKLRAYLLEAGF